MGLSDWLGKRTPSRVPADAQPRRADLQSHLVEPRELLLMHRDRLESLRLEGGYGAEQAARLIDASALRVAEYVHLLPATRCEYHAEPGGLLRLAIEVATFAFRRGDGQFLAGALVTDARNRERERAWRFAAFLGGLLRPLGRCSTQVQVLSGQGLTWDAHREGLWDWLQRQGATAVDLRWRNHTDARREEPSTVWIASRLVLPAAYEYLALGGNAVLETLVHIIGGVSATRVGAVVAAAHQAAIDLDLVRRGKARAAEAVPIPLEHHVLDALRSLIREKWACNSPGGRVWATERGVFIQWRPAFADLLPRLRADGVSGVPRDPDTLAELLLTRRIVRASGSTRPYQRIVPLLKGSPKQPIEVVQLEDPALLGVNVEEIELIEVEWAETKSPVIAVSATTPGPKTLPLPLELATSTSAQDSRRPLARAMRPRSAEAGRGPGAVAAHDAAAAGAQLSGPRLVEASGKSLESPAQSQVSVRSEHRASVADGDETDKGDHNRLGGGLAEVEVNANAHREARERLERLAQFGADVAPTLRALGERFAGGQTVPGVVAMQEGVALEFPQTIVLLGQEPHQFLAACERQGLLVADKKAGGALVHQRSDAQLGLPDRYIILSSRAARYLPPMRSG